MGFEEKIELGFWISSERVRRKTPKKKLTNDSGQRLSYTKRNPSLYIYTI